MTSTVIASITKTDEGMALTGQLVFASVTDLLKQGNPITQRILSTKNAKTFVIDCQQMERIDSAGIALLLEWQRQFSSAKLICRFAGLTTQAESLIQAYRLQSLVAA